MFNKLGTKENFLNQVKGIKKKKKKPTANNILNSKRLNVFSAKSSIGQGCPF